MDLLGSILNSMEKPPEVDEKRKEQMKSEYPTHFMWIVNILQMTMSFILLIVIFFCQRKNKNNISKSNRSMKKRSWLDFGRIVKSGLVASWRMKSGHFYNFRRWIVFIDRLCMHLFALFNSFVIYTRNAEVASNCLYVTGMMWLK